MALCSDPLWLSGGSMFLATLPSARPQVDSKRREACFWHCMGLKPSFYLLCVSEVGVGVQRCSRTFSSSLKYFFYLLIQKKKKNMVIPSCAMSDSGDAKMVRLVPGKPFLPKRNNGLRLCFAFSGPLAATAVPHLPPAPFPRVSGEGA